LIVETSGHDALLLSVIEAYCTAPTNSKTTVAKLNTPIPKTRHSIQGTADYTNIPNLPTKSVDM
jgi:hypothetical protein